MEGIKRTSLLEVVRKCGHIHTLGLSKFPKLDDDTVIRVAGLLRNVLEAVDLSDCEELGDGAMIAISKCRNLKSLIISRCQRVTDEGIRKVLKGCKKLSRLLVDDTHTTDKSFDLAEFPPISVLGLSFTSITGFALEKVAKFCGSTLTVLYMAKCNHVTPEAMEVLCSRCSYLEFLNISGSFASAINAVAPFIAQLQNLRTLKVAFSAMNDETVQTIVSSCHLLQYFDVGNSDLLRCPHIESQNLEELCMRDSSNLVNPTIVCPQLKTLDLPTSKALNQMTIICPKLSRLSINCNFLQNAQIQCQSLESLTLPNCNLSSDVLSRICQECPNLAKLNVSHNQSLSRVSLQSIKLEALTASRCTNLSSLDLDCPLLSTIDISKCPQLDDDGWRPVVQKCKDLISIFVSLYPSC